jgi:hypothetical protein
MCSHEHSLLSIEIELAKPAYSSTANVTTSGKSNAWQFKRITMSKVNLTLELAQRFMAEVLGSVETLGGIADQHGVQTLVDLMYLQDAILKQGFIDEGNSKVNDILKTLPSAAIWMGYVRSGELANRRVVGPPRCPYVLETGLQEISEITTASHAQECLEALETLYDEHYLEEQKGWTWYDTHPLDHSAFIELTEVIRASSAPPLDTSLLTEFRTQDWRKPFEPSTERNTVAA